ncbi:MAG: methyltransferase domain-containing protein [Gammaproteobacteria bacterium]|nr:methyltransferase domain-containing protein [Gammaproteobacteria bacterium]
MVRLTDLAKAFIAPLIRPGDRVIDATLGNGQDSLFLARATGPTGQLFAFDIQPQALEISRQRLQAAGCLEQAQLILASHSQIDRFVRGKTIAAAMFNLGYLPGGDKQRITSAEHSLRGLAACSRLLAPGGGISLLAYPGHPGGEQEADAVQAWAEGLDPQHWQLELVQAQSENRQTRTQPPRLICLKHRP